MEKECFNWIRKIHAACPHCMHVFNTAKLEDVESRYLVGMKLQCPNCKEWFILNSDLDKDNITSKSLSEDDMNQKAEFIENQIHDIKICKDCNHFGNSEKCPQNIPTSISCPAAEPIIKIDKRYYIDTMLNQINDRDDTEFKILEEAFNKGFCYNNENITENIKAVSRFLQSKE